VQTLASWTVNRAGSTQTIELLQGDITAIPPEHAVDIVVVSAFPNSYSPNPGTVIGAFDRRGVSVARLAQAKQIDLREDCSCWISKPVPMGDRNVRILCIESGWRGSPPEITDDLFRALAPSSIFNFPNATVAMPVIGSGNQGWPVEQMFDAMLASAIGWFRRGLALRALKIVVYAPATAERVLAGFQTATREAAAGESPARPAPAPAMPPAAAPAPGAAPVAPAPAPPGARAACDVFLSYAHHDAALARVAYDRLTVSNPALKIFYDRKTLTPGSSWLLEIAETLDAAQRVVALYTPEYWQSPYCKDEFIAAFTRQHDTGARILYPIFLRDANIPYMFRSIQYEDCRPDDQVKLLAACQALSAPS